ncbi:MAG: ABC transporter ATP-binding protein [Pseudomonadota bacterium]
MAKEKSEKTGENMLLDAREITKTFPSNQGRTTILDAVSLNLDTAQSLALTGESGSGKSTLLHIIASLEPFDSGSLQLDGQDVGPLREPARARLRRVSLGIIFQQFNLIPSLTVERNLTFQARLSGRQDDAWTRELIHRLGLEDHASKYPEDLSGGQQQRVAVGRALASRPKLVLADEPTGSLDEVTGDQVLTLMLDLVRDSQAALLMVTHSDRLAHRLDQRVHLRRGRLET